MTSKAAVKMHSSTPETIALREDVINYARERMALDPAPLDGPQTLKFLQKMPVELFLKKVWVVRKLSKYLKMF